MLDRFSVWFTDWLMDHPRTVAGFLGLLFVGSLVAVPFLPIETGIEPLFDRSSPLQKTLDEVEAHFVNDDLLYLAYGAEDVFSHEALEAARKLTAALEAMRVKNAKGEEVPGFDDVTSLTTVKDLYGSDLNFRTGLLVPEQTPTGADALEKLRERAFDNVLVRDGLVAKSNKGAAIVARLTTGLTEHGDSELVTKARALARQAQGWPELTAAHVTGAPVIRADSANFMLEDLAVLLPAVYFIIVALLYLFLRTIWGVVLVGVNVTVAMVVGVGVLVVMGGSLNSITTMLPPVMVILGASIVVYFLFEMAKHAQDGAGVGVARQTLRELLVPAFMCILTTIVGFGSLSVSSIPAVRQFGVAMGVALFVSFFLSFGILAWVSAKYPWSTFISPKGWALSTKADALIEWYGGVVVRRPWPLLGLAALVLLVTALGIPKIVSDTNLLRNFRPGTLIRKADAFVAQEIAGTSTLVVSIRAKDGHFLEPEALKKLEALEVFLEKELRADTVTSMVDHVKLMHRAFFNEDDAYLTIPPTRDQVAQLVLLNGDERFGDYVDGKRGWVRIEARTQEHGSGVLRPIFEKLEAYLAREFPAAEGYVASATGKSRLVAATMDTVVESQTNSLSLSFLLIFGPIFLVFRSIRAGLFSIPSNLFPIGVTLGLMGWTGIELDVPTAMVSSVSLGIAVDDTIHFLQYLRLRIATHGDVPKALRETFRIKGMGATWTAIAMSCGFLVCIASNFQPTRYFGIFTAVALITGVIGEMLILPPLILLTKSRLGVPLPGAGKVLRTTASPEVGGAA